MGALVRKLLLQLDSSRLPSVFDRVVAYDAGADEVLSYGGVTAADVPDLVRGAIFTRGPQDLRNSAVFIGGSDVGAGEELLAAAQSALFGPFRVSMMLDSNGSNTTAVATVARILQTLGDVRGRRAVVLAGTGPVGRRVAGLLIRGGAEVVITSRRKDEGAKARDAIAARFGRAPTVRELSDPARAADAIDGAEIVVAAGPAGVLLVPRSAWTGREGLAVVIDLNAVPPLGIEGVEAGDNATRKDDVVAFGALGVGSLKMKLHKAAIARLFERNDLVLDVDAIAEVARELTTRRDAAAAAAAPDPPQPSAAPITPSAREAEAHQR